LSGNAAQPEPGVIFPPVEILGIAELRTEGKIEADTSFAAEEIPDLIAAKLLGNGTLPPEEAVAALHGLGVAFPDRDDRHFSYSLHQHLHGRVTVAGDILDTRPQFIGIGDAFYGSAVPHP